MPPRTRRLRRAAMELCQTLRTLRSGIGAQRLRDDAVQQCTRAIAEAVRDGDLDVAVHPGAVCQGDVPVVQLGRREPPFALLRDAGVGRILVPRGTAPATVAAFLRTLAELSPPETGGDPLGSLRTRQFAGIHLLPPDAEPQAETNRRTGVDWSLLPQPTGTTLLQRRAESTCRRNLHFAAARLLLADLDTADPVTATVIGHLCQGLFDDVIQRGDASTAAWLLEQMQHHDRIDADLPFDMRATADGAFRGAWLDEQVAEPSRVDGLAALAIELGDAALRRLADAAGRADAPLPPWLQEMLEGT